jgi:hypothetical protein
VEAVAQTCCESDGLQYVQQKKKGRKKKKERKKAVTKRKPEKRNERRGTLGEEVR